MNVGKMSLRGTGDECYAINFVRNLKYDLKQDIICGQILTLKFVTVSKIAHTLWRNYMCKIKLSEIPNAFDKYEKEIKNNISNLNIPNMWKKKLEEFVHLIKDEFLNFFLQYIINFISKDDNFHIYWDDLCWTQQNSVDRVKTVAQIIDKSNLSIMDKYVLACENCLEEKIRHWHELLPEDFITKFEGESDPNFLVLFWTYYIKGKQEKFSDIIQGAEPNNYLLDWSIKKKKDAAVQYIWEKFGNEASLKERLNYYFDIVISEYSDCNIAFYFFQQLSKIRQEEMIKEVLYILLRKVRNVLRWSNAIYIEKYVFEMIKSKNVLDAFKIVMYCGDYQLLDLKQYETLWNEFILHFKFDLETMFIDIWNEFFREHNFGVVDKHYYKISYFSLLRAGASQDIKARMYTDDAGNACVRLIAFYGPDIMNALLKRAFETEDEISEFRYHFFSTMGSKICY